MQVKGSINPWSSRLLIVLCLVLSFLVPYSGGVLVQKALTARWERYGFTPDGTLSWWDNSVYSMKTAIKWRSKGFTASGMRQWKAMDISPEEASEWRDARADVAAAVEWRRYAFAPERAADWMRFQFGIGDAIAWRKHGFEAKEAASWREKGMSPTGAARAKRSGAVQ